MDDNFVFQLNVYCVQVFGEAKKDPNLISLRSAIVCKIRSVAENQKDNAKEETKKKHYFPQIRITNLHWISHLAEKLNFQWYVDMKKSR